MSEEKQEVVETQIDNVVSDSKDENTELPNKITDPLERLAALQEIDVLSKLIGTSYFMPKWDKGNNGKEQPKITGSIQLNYFNGKNMSEWGARIALLTYQIS